MAVRDGDFGGMILPEAKLNADTLVNAGKEAKSFGQLWLLVLAPMNAGEAVPASKLRKVHVRAARKSRIGIESRWGG